MSIQEVKDQLPDVTIRYADYPTTYPASVSGRLNRFATVTRIDNGMQWEFSWEAVTRAVNTGRSLLV